MDGEPNWPTFDRTSHGRYLDIQPRMSTQGNPRKAKRRELPGPPVACHGVPMASHGETLRIKKIMSFLILDRIAINAR